MRRVRIASSVMTRDSRAATFVTGIGGKKKGQGTTMSDWYMWPVVAASILGTVTNIHHRRWCFAVWVVTNGLWVLYLGPGKSAWPAAALQFIYFCLSLYGVAQWGNPQMNERERCNEPQ
jgi:hypothetical protein